MPVPPALLRRTAATVLETEGGLAHLQSFLGAGLTRRQVSHLQLCSTLVRPRTGWYLDPAAPSPARQAVRVGGVLGCVSAAQTLGIVTPEGHGRLTHVSLDPTSSRLRRSDAATRRAAAGDDAAVRWHWEETLLPRTGWRVSALDSLVQMAACVSLPWLTAAVDSARCATYGPPLIDDAELAGLRPGAPALLQAAIARSDPLAESSGETFIRLGLQAVGVPVASQVWLTDDYRTDLLVDGWLPIESDGVAHHSGEAVERDRERDAQLAWLGHAPLRFTQSMAVRKLPFVIDTVVRVWQRGPGGGDPAASANARGCSRIRRCRATPRGRGSLRGVSPTIF